MKRCLFVKLWFSERVHPFPICANKLAISWRHVFRGDWRSFSFVLEINNRKVPFSSSFFSRSTQFNSTFNFEVYERTVVFTWNYYIFHSFFSHCCYGFLCHIHSEFAGMPRNSLFNRRNIWILSDCNGTQTHNHLARKWTQLFSQTGQFGWKSACLRTMWLWVQVLLQSPRLCFYCFRNKKQTSHANCFNLSFESTILEEIMMAMGGSVKRST